MATGPNAKPLLVVEDNDIAREGLCIILRRAGYKVMGFPDGQGALDYLRDGNRPALILLDMLLPVLDGWKFLEEVRNWSKPLRVPIIVTTGTILTREWAADHGCAGFLHKPIELDELLAEVRRCLAVERI